MMKSRALILFKLKVKLLQRNLKIINSKETKGKTRNRIFHTYRVA